MINKWRAMPTSQTPQRENMATMYQIRRDNTINGNINNAINNAWNMNNENKVDWSFYAPGKTMLITTNWGNLFNGILMNDNDVWEVIELTDVKRWWEPIKIPATTDNKIGFRKLSNKESWDLKLRYNWNEISIDDFVKDKKKQLQDEFDKYMKAFKSYQSASPETKKAVEPLMEEALKNYYNLKINLYK